MGRFASYLPELGWEPVVVAPSDTPHAVDPRLGSADIEVVRSRSLELSQLGRAIPGGQAGAGSTGLRTMRQRTRASLRATAHRYLFYPDPQIGWYPGALRAGLRRLRGGGFDAIYSSSNPITGHLVARSLARRANLPWVAEFRDPWSDRLADDHPHRRRAAKLEASLAHDATGIVVPTPRLAELWGARWGKEVALIPNGHDLDGPTPQPPADPVLTHVGNYYPGRQSFQALWAALEERGRAGLEPAPRLRFVGEAPREVLEEMADAGLSHLLEVTGFLPHEEAMCAMAASTMLIASGFAGEDPVSRGVIPAKLFEYLASGLPILYLGSPADDAGRLLAGQPGCHVVEPADVAGVLAALEESLSGPIHHREVEQFSRRARTKALAGVLDAAIRAS